MTIHFYTFSNAQGGSSRQRAFRVVDELRARGLEVMIHEPPVLSISRTHWPKKFTLILQVIRSLFSIKKGDIIYLQRTVSNKYFFVIMVAYIWFFRRKMTFDFDDPVWLHSYLKTKVFTQLADTVITCSHAQAEWARQFNKNVHVIHIALDFAAYKKFTKDYSAASNPVVVGWVGTGPEHLYNLQNLAGVFEELLKKSPAPFKFVLIGALKSQKVYEVFQKIPGLKVEFIDALDWNNPESVPREIQKFDIGVVPHRSDGEWNKAKTSFKVLEYMACGVATIASAFGEMPYIIKDSTEGYIADTKDEWVEKLQKLLLDKELRAQFGHNGQVRVREEYCFDAIVPRLMEIFKTLERVPNR
ncbi:MAG: group 1 glycosyl transferase [Parcubacteria group bacterium Gr01-1014_56]|nr:MAG: group 1 glycosyl transferase [Parcubacteria group bacterium Gr01-1014_56]